jgi:uncharacterized protein YgbK (DUF1537 family)
MTTLRLLADDLTGALDTAGEFVGITGPIDAFWHGGIPTELPMSAALDSGSRELESDTAAFVTAKLAPVLNGAAIAFMKVDSLMRGPTFAEIAACIRVGGWRYAVMAPAFPYQGRVTRGGIQYACDARCHWVAVSDDMVSRLRTMGMQAHIGRANAPLPPGISVFDAETDADLDRIVADCRAVDPVLWIGTGGMAQALARPSPPQANAQLPSPLLGLFGSDHAVTARQLAACGTDWMTLRDGNPAEVRSIAVRLRTTGQMVASVELPPGLDRKIAAGRIAVALHRLVRDLPPPGTLLVAGGETLRGLCLSLEACSLAIEGRLVPGVPRSRIRGGLWDGATVVSKSGAFGPPNLLRDLLHRAHAPTERKL